jgi:hypothetical protein
MTSARAAFGLVVAVLAGAVLGGCEGAISDKVPAAGDSPSGDTSVGSVQLALQLAGGVRLDTVSYRVSGGTFVKTGTLDVSNSNTVSAVISPIPAGTGYSVSLQAAATEVAAQRALGCQGSSTLFNVAADATTPVSVHMICREARQPPPMVPIPRSAVAALAFLLALAGARALRRVGGTPS